MVKTFLNQLYEKYNNKDYIHTDPIYFPHTLEGNKEFIAFTAALFAYGNVKAMTRFLKKLFDAFGGVPSTSIETTNLKYRFQTAADINNYMAAMKNVYEDYGSIHGLMAASVGRVLNEKIKSAFVTIRERYLAKPLSSGLNFLFALPGNSASKRLTMFLRWMVRKDEVDFGLWYDTDRTQLNIPLDTHIIRLCTHMGIIKNERGKSALEKANAYFRKLEANDPVKYDFSLTRLGIIHGCKYEPSARCADCEFKKRCIWYRE
jgi:uncharacterized protein (TIGR02757 family)